jgi:hypothetical protein
MFARSERLQISGAQNGDRLAFVPDLQSRLNRHRGRREMRQVGEPGHLRHEALPRWQPIDAAWPVAHYAALPSVDSADLYWWMTVQRPLIGTSVRRLSGRRHAA